jgi:hypothetical protein
MIAQSGNSSGIVLFSGLGDVLLNDTWEYYVLRGSVFASPLHGTTPLEVHLSNNVTGFHGAPQFLWTFGDGNSSTSPSLNYSFENPGVHLVTLIVADGDESTITFEFKISPDLRSSEAGKSPLGPLLSTYLLFSIATAGVAAMAIVAAKRRFGRGSR